MILDLLDQTAVSEATPPDPLNWLTSAFATQPDVSSSHATRPKPAVLLETAPEAEHEYQPIRYFEGQLARFFETTHAIICQDSTEAIQAVLVSLGLEPDDEVIIPALGGKQLVQAVEALGLKAVVADIDKSTFHLTAASIEPLITSRTKAIVPVHLFGQCANMEALLNLACEHKLHIVEEATQAVGAVYTFANRTIRKVGTLGHASILALSVFASVGGPTTGGLVLTDNDALAAKLRLLFNDGNHAPELKPPYANGDISTAVLSCQHMQQIYQSNLMRLLSAVTYDDLLLDVPGVHTPGGVPFSTHIFHEYVLLVTRGRRDGLARFLSDNGVELTETRGLMSVDATIADYPVATSVASSVLSLPVHSGVDRSSQEFICALIDEYMSEHEFASAPSGRF